MYTIWEGEPITFCGDVLYSVHSSLRGLETSAVVEYNEGKSFIYYKLDERSHQMLFEKGRQNGVAEERAEQNGSAVWQEFGGGSCKGSRWGWGSGIC